MVGGGTRRLVSICLSFRSMAAIFDAVLWIFLVRLTGVNRTFPLSISDSCSLAKGIWNRS